MKILYFARIRQIAGKSSQEIEVPETVKTVRELIAHLSELDESVAAALAETRTLRAAVNQAHVPLDAPLAGAREVAFFPPVTGG